LNSQTLFNLENISFFLAILNTKEAKLTISEEEKASLVQGIIESASKMMERIITTKSPKNRARDWCKPHQQSKTGITRGTVLFNILTNTQRLPARPRDFRINLAGEEKSIGDSELSDILALSVRNYLLEHKRDNFPFPRGSPKSDEKTSGIADERRGTLSYYTPSRIRSIIDEILSDPKSIESIDKAILHSKVFYSFAKYYYEVCLYQMKEDEQAFLNTMSPAIRKYGLRHKSTKELDSLDIYARDLTPDKIDNLTKGYAINTMNKLQQDGKNILYTVAALFSILNVYSSGNLKQE
jgi:hypothetical protein